MKNTDLVVGAGITGAVLANLLSRVAKRRVIVIDKTNHIGGMCYDKKEKDITIQCFGPHIFHTNNSKVRDFLSHFTKWKEFNFKPKAYIGGKFISIPFNFSSIDELFFQKEASEFKKALQKFGVGNSVSILQMRDNSDKKIKEIAEFIFDKMYKNYTFKQWGKPFEEIDTSVLERVKVHIGYDSRYFKDDFQAIPLNGYSCLIENLLDHKNIEVILNCDFKDLKEECERIFYTGSIDEFFNYEYGILPYRSLDFEFKTLDLEYYQPAAMVNYPNENLFTRIIEHKRFLDEKTNHTVISFEYPTNHQIGKNTRFYPVLNKESRILKEKYIKKASLLQNVFFVGRLGSFQYINMDEAVLSAFNLFDKLTTANV